MKKPIMIQTVVLLAVTLLLACQLGMMPHGMGKIRVQCVVPDELTGLAGKTGAKGLIGPPSGYRLASYRLTFTADNGEVVTKTLSRGSGEVTLKVGGWTCLAEGLTADGVVIVEKTLHISTEPGKTLDLAIPLHLAKGKGSLQIAFSPSQAPSAEWKYAVSLVYRGLPGDSSFQGPQEFSTEIPATETGLSVADLDSGYYSLAIQLKDATSATIAGTTTTVLVLPGQSSTGECHITLSDPLVTISVTVPNLELSVDAAIAADRYLNRNKAMAVPLALGQNGSDLSIDWYLNGAKLEGNQRDISQNLPGFRIVLGENDAPTMQTTMKMEALLTEVGSGLSNVLSHTSSISAGPASGTAEWIQSIDYHAAMSPSLFTATGASNTGTGIQENAKWVATNAGGLIAVAGLDKNSAIHLFYSPCGADLSVPSSAGWLRLWRDKVVVDKNERSPDRVSISPDGSFIALGASTSNWFRIYALNGAGEILSTTDIVSTKNGAPTFENIKAIQFSADSGRLFILANAPEKILMFNVQDVVSDGEVQDVHEFSFAGCFDPPPSSSLGMEDMILLPDGWIAACSSNIARVFFVHYSEAEGQFSADPPFAGGANNESLGDPKSIAFDEESGLCYVLGYSKKLHIFSKADASSSYTPLATWSLLDEFDKARSLAFVENRESGAKFLVVGGGAGLGIVALAPSGQPSAFSFLDSPVEDYSGIGSIANLAPLGGSVVASGGSSGVVAMFDIR